MSDEEFAFEFVDDGPQPSAPSQLGIEEVVGFLQRHYRRGESQVSLAVEIQERGPIEDLTFAQLVAIGPDGSDLAADSPILTPAMYQSWVDDQKRFRDAMRLGLPAIRRMKGSSGPQVRADISRHAHGVLQKRQLPILQRSLHVYVLDQELNRAKAGTDIAREIAADPTTLAIIYLTANAPQVVESADVSTDLEKIARPPFVFYQIKSPTAGMDVRICYDVGEDLCLRLLSSNDLDTTFSEIHRDIAKGLSFGGEYMRARGQTYGI